MDNGFNSDEEGGIIERLDASNKIFMRILHLRNDRSPTK